MDMSDVSRTRLPAATAAERWRDLVAQLSVEVAAPLSAALERVHALSSTGQIDRAGLRALHEELAQAREAGMIGQQLARFASGRLRQAHERVALAQALQELLAQRAREAQERGLQLRPSLRPLEVIVDPSLLVSLLNALLDWAFANADATLDLRLELKPWPAQARLTCRFACRESGHGRDAQPVRAGLDSLAWRLVEQTAATMGLQLERHDGGAETVLAIEFPRTVNDAVDGLSSLEVDPAALAAPGARPLAGHHLLVVTDEPALREEVLAAVRGMGLIVDCVDSIAAAAAFCRDGLPHAIAYAASLRGDALERLQAEVSLEAPEFVFIEILGSGRDFQVSSFSDSGCARVGRDALSTALPSALVFELSKAL